MSEVVDPELGNADGGCCALEGATPSPAELAVCTDRVGEEVPQVRRGAGPQQGAECPLQALRHAYQARSAALRLTDLQQRVWEVDICSALFGTGCDETLQSRTAVQLGLPLAGWGLIYYGTLASLLLLGWAMGDAFQFEASLTACLLATALFAGPRAATTQALTKFQKWQQASFFRGFDVGYYCSESDCVRTQQDIDDLKDTGANLAQIKCWNSC